MTLLGVGGFNMGSSGNEPSTMNMSLDEMIASRQRNSSRKGGRKNDDPNKVSNVDRTIATGRAKREAAMRARRGLSNTRKASSMEIEAAVQKQAKQTLMERVRKTKQGNRKASKLNDADRVAVRQERRKLARAAAKAKREELAASGGKGGRAAAPNKPALGKVAETAPLGRPPSKKAVKAAMTAMEDKGFKVPQGYQMVISFAPNDSATSIEPERNAKPAGKKNGPNNNNKGNRRPGGGGRH